jgi:hypothetical protein
MLVLLLSDHSDIIAHILQLKSIGQAILYLLENHTPFLSRSDPVWNLVPGQVKLPNSDKT